MENILPNGDDCILQAVLEVVKPCIRVVVLTNSGSLVVVSIEDEFIIVDFKAVKLAEVIALLVILVEVIGLLVIFIESIEDELAVVVDSTVLDSEIALHRFIFTLTIIISVSSIYVLKMIYFTHK